MRGVPLPSDEEEYIVWIVWKLVGDKPVLVAIDGSEARAARHVAMVKDEARVAGEPPPETFVEQSWLNHRYGESVTDLPSFKIAKLTKEKGWR